MSDYRFLHDALSDLWVVLAPRRKKRPDIAHLTLEAVCPFCIGQEGKEQELFRIPARQDDGSERGSSSSDSNWQVRVLPNKYPFAPHHEVIIHSPDHHKNIDELPIENVEYLLQTYRQRFKIHVDQGKVYIFNNHGMDGGESVPHPHTQLVVIPQEVKTAIPLLGTIPDEKYETDYFTIFCPEASQWPDEVWIAPKKNGEGFQNIEDAEIADLALAMQRILQIMDMRHGHEFPFNYYISPEKQWYVRIMPRVKRLGGFEIGTGIFVNTQDPQETIRFIKSNFETPDIEKIMRENRAEYATGV